MLLHLETTTINRIKLSSTEHANNCIFDLVFNEIPTISINDYSKYKVSVPYFFLKFEYKNKQTTFQARLYSNIITFSNSNPKGAILVKSICKPDIVNRSAEFSSILQEPLNFISLNSIQFKLEFIEFEKASAETWSQKITPQFVYIILDISE